MWKAVVAAAALAMIAPPGEAHDKWADGSAIPSWVKSSCCGPQDAHHLTPDQVHRVKGGYRVDGYPDVIEDERVLPSQDGDYWIFYNQGDTAGAPWFSRVYCFFIPMST